MLWSRSTFCTAGLLLVFLSCGGKEDVSGKTVPEGPPDKVVEPERLPIDAAIVVDAVVEFDAAVLGESVAPDGGASEELASTKKPKKHTVAELAGLWSGSAAVPSYGTVIASVRLNKKGKGTYSAKISGFTKTGSVQVLSWNGKTIRARGGGMQRSVPAKLSGNRLTLRLPLVGKVIVYRGK